MGMTSIEKILASHSDSHRSSPVTWWWSTSTSAVFFDSMRSDISRYRRPRQAGVAARPQVPAPTVQAANMAKQMREFVEKFGMKNYFPVGAARHLARAGGPGGLGPAGQDPGQRRTRTPARRAR